MSAGKQPSPSLSPPPPSYHTRHGSGQADVPTPTSLEQSPSAYTRDDSSTIHKDNQSQVRLPEIEGGSPLDADSIWWDTSNPSLVRLNHRGRDNAVRNVNLIERGQVPILQLPTIDTGGALDPSFLWNPSTFFDREGLSQATYLPVDRRLLTVPYQSGPVEDEGMFRQLSRHLSNRLSQRSHGSQRSRNSRHSYHFDQEVQQPSGHNYAKLGGSQGEGVVRRASKRVSQRRSENLDTIAHRISIHSKTDKKPSEPQYLKGSKLILLMTGLVTAAFLITLNASIVATAIPSITSRFDSTKDVGWYGSAYLITNCVFLPLSGKLYAFYRSKIVFVAFLAVFEIGSLICATANSSSMFIAGRTVAGAGGAGIFNGAFVIIAAAAPVERRPFLAGIAGSLATTGQVMGPLLGGVLTQKVNWRWCFYINIPIGAAVMVLLILITIPNSNKKRENRPSLFGVLWELDLLGFSLFTPACVLALLALELGGKTKPWNSVPIIGLFAGAGGCALVWLAWDWWRGDKAMIPLSLFRNRIVTMSSITALLQWGGLMVLTYYLPIWFQTVKGDGALMSGVSILPTMVPQVIAGLVSGYAVTKLGYYLPWALLGSALTAAGGGLLSTFNPGSGLKIWIPYQVLAGLGRGMVLQMPIIAVQTTLPKPKIPVGTGLVSFCQYFGGTFFVTFAETIFSIHLPDALRTYAPNANAEQIQTAGATSIRNLVPADQLAGVLEAYNYAITRTFYLAAAAGGVAFLTALGMGWKSVKKAKQQQQQQQQKQEEKSPAASSDGDSNAKTKAQANANATEHDNEKAKTSSVERERIKKLRLGKIVPVKPQTHSSERQ